MESALLIGIALIVVAGVGYMAWKTSQLQPQNVDDERWKEAVEKANARIGELTSAVKQAESKRDELAGKNKEMFAAHTKLDAEYKAVSKALAKYEAEEQKRTESLTRQSQELTAARKALEDERERVRAADEERLKELEEERDRLWNEHEQSVVALLRDLCKKPEYGFTTYDNTNLPDGFDGSLKPDFMIEFLNQYVIFDAKASKAQSLQTYINNAVKTTVEKIRKNDKIAKFLYLVVPSLAIGELKNYRYVNGDYTIYVISPESLAPILAALKRITAYEFAEQLDPKDRENIVNLIAKFDSHISFRNALDIVLAKQGADLVNDIRQLSPDIAEDILARKDKLGLPSLKQPDIKRLMNATERIQEIDGMENPRPKVLKKAVDAAKAALFE